MTAIAETPGRARGPRRDGQEKLSPEYEFIGGGL
jgi:hypothetical protein